MKQCLFCKKDFNASEKRIKFCSKSCAASYNNLGRKLSKDHRIKIRNSVKKYYETHEHHAKNRISVICMGCKNVFETTVKSNKKYCSKMCRYSHVGKTLSMSLKGKTGGLRHGSGRGKQGWYKGYYCNSSWELAWVIYQLEHGVRFKRNTKGFEYEFNGKKLKFYPDFILESGDYIEVKGYTDDKVKAKFEGFPHKLRVIGKSDINLFIQYAVGKYGVDYIKLYECSLPH